MTINICSVKNKDSQGENVETFEVFLEKQQGSFGLNVTVSIYIQVRSLIMETNQHCYLIEQ